MELQLVSREQVLQFRSKSIVSYTKYHGLQRHLLNSNKFMSNANKLKDRERYIGKMSKGAKKRLQKAVSLLIQSSRHIFVDNPITGKSQAHHISFITLTLPDIDKSKDAKFTHKYLLQPLLRVLRSRFLMHSYVWKCELQKNGSVHYHITSDCFIVHSKLREVWNNILRSKDMLLEFKNQYGHDNPNSTDVHSVKKVHDLEAYLLKYISKESQNQVSLGAKVWDCSKNLKEGKYFTTTLTTDLHEHLTYEMHMGWITPVYLDRSTILKFSVPDYYVTMSQSIITEYQSHLNKISTWQNLQTGGGVQGTSQLAQKSQTTQSSDKGSVCVTKYKSTGKYRGKFKPLPTPVSELFSQSVWSR